VDDATDAVSVELYSTKLGLTEKPNIHYVLATDGRRLVGSVPGLEAGAGYRAAVRAHRRGCAEDGANGTWSGLTWLDGVCTPLPGSDARLVESARPRDDSGPVTHWLEVFRISEAGRLLVRLSAGTLDANPEPSSALLREGAVACVATRAARLFGQPRQRRRRR
jgi:hypothetical protein